MLKRIQILSVLSRRFWNQLRTQGPVMTAWAAVDWIHRAVTGRPMRYFSEICDDLYIGGQPSEKFFKPLRREWGVTGIVNMRSEHNYEIKVEGIVFNYLYLPTSDNEAPSLEHLMQGVDFILDEIEDNHGRVYIHCWEGLGRGPTMAAAYFVATGMTPEEAWKEIRRKRPFIRPTEIQLKQLERFADTYEPHIVEEPPTVKAEPVAVAGEPAVTSGS